ELGTTAEDGTGFLPLSGEVPLVPGAQGGFHVWVKYRVFGLAPGDVKVVRSATRARDGRAILSAVPIVQEIGPASEAGYWECAQAIPSFMCPTPVGVSVRDEAVDLRLELKVGGEATPAAEATARVVPRCRDGDAFCARICSG